jgi:two-component system, sensor histidine kinase and response regulator
LRRQAAVTKILIIDDDSLMRSMIKNILENYGFSAITASDGLEGVELAQNDSPDLIISDIKMPKLDGFQVFKKLQEDEQTQTIPFIFLTGQNNSEAFRQGMKLGADDYLTKPFDAEDLVNTINIRLKRQKMIEKKFDTTLNLLRKSITYTLPHELRTPLMGILGYGELLRMDYQTMNSDQILVFADEIVKAGTRLHRVIENYLVYAQLELVATNNEEIEAIRRHLVVADKVLKQYAEATADKYNRRDDLSLELAPHLGLRISEENLGKMITELVDNACKFSDLGSPVHVKAFRDENTVIIEVNDDGRGMSEKEIGIIGAYMQFERAVYEQQGMGLGLPIVIRLGEIHNSRLQIESQKDVGTCATLRFDMY